MVKYKMSLKGLYSTLYENYYRAYLICALILVILAIRIVYIEWQHCLLNAKIAQTMIACAKQRKEYDHLQKQSILLDAMLQEYTTQEQSMHTMSLKQTCALLFDQHSQYALDLVCYSYQLNAQSVQSAQVHIKGDYEPIINFCKALHDQFPALRCTIDSLTGKEGESLEAKLTLTMYKEVPCIVQ